MIQELQNTTEYHSYFDTWPCPEDVILMLLQSYIKFRSWNNCLKYKLHNSKGHWTPLRLDWTVIRILCLQHLHSLMTKLCRDVAQERWDTEPQNHPNVTIPQRQTHNIRLFNLTFQINSCLWRVGMHNDCIQSSDRWSINQHKSWAETSWSCSPAQLLLLLLLLPLLPPSRAASVCTEWTELADAQTSC